MFEEPRRQEGTRVSDIPFEVIATDYFGSYELPAGVYVACDESELETIWARLHEGSGRPPSPPAIDWSDTVAMFVHLGTRPSTGYAVGIERITSTPIGVTVEALEITPGPPSAVGRAQTAPHQVVTMPKFDGTAVLSIRTQARS